MRAGQRAYKCLNEVSKAYIISHIFIYVYFFLPFLMAVTLKGWGGGTGRDIERGEARRGKALMA